MAFKVTIHDTTATALTANLQAVFGPRKIDGYDTTAKIMLEVSDVQIGEDDDGNDRANLIPFRYNWRLSNRFSARRLPASSQARKGACVPRLLLCAEESTDS